MAVQQAGTGVDSGFTAKPALRATDPEVAALMDEELTRQEETLELIPSENLASVAVLEALGSWLNNKYAEGVPGKRYYGGCQVVDQVENLARDRCKQLFGADHANVQPHSGSQANMAVYASVLKPGDTVLGMALDQGGHLTHGSPVNFSGKLYNFEAYTVSDANGRIDYDEVRARAHEVAPVDDRGRVQLVPAPPRLRRVRGHRPRRRAPCCSSTWRTSPGWSRVARTRRRCPTPTSSPSPPTRRCAVPGVG